MNSIGRNELCYCGSGKKYKKCCLNKQMKIQEDKEFAEGMQRVLFGMQEMKLKKKPHIREYRKLRDLHAEVIGDMMEYFYDGHYNWSYSDKEAMKKSTSQTSINIEFDPNDNLGRQALPNLLIYNHGLESPSISDVFLEKNKYRKPEKVQFVKDMLDSVESLFEIISIDSTNGYATLKDVFNDKEYKLTDLSLSCNYNYEKVYLYTRIITSKGISFGTGMGMSFVKTDSRIINWIKKHKKTYSKKTELSRFTTIYALYQSIRDNEVNTVMNEV